MALDDEGHSPETLGLREIFDPTPEQVEELFDESDFAGEGDKGGEGIASIEV